MLIFDIIDIEMDYRLVLAFAWYTFETHVISRNNTSQFLEK